MKILLIGGYGRLGKAIAQKLSERSVDFSIIEKSQTESFDVFKKTIVHAIEQYKRIILLDVSTAQTTLKISQFLEQYSLKEIYLVVGTTGHSSECCESLKSLALSIPVCIVPNFSKGILLLNALLRKVLSTEQSVSAFAKSLGFDISLIDKHHKHKKDAPSGTAFLINQILGLEKHQISSVREGETIGVHSINFKSQNESVELTHTAHSRDVFAEGACDLCVRFYDKNLKSGLYSAADIF